MDYLRPFRDRHASEGVLRAIRDEADPGRRYSFMEFCGSHTHTIARFGIEQLLPANLRMIHGPG